MKLVECVYTVNVVKVKYQCTFSHNDDNVIFLVYFPFLRRRTYVSYHLSTFESMDQFLWISWFLCNWRTPYHTSESLTISNNDSDMHKLVNWKHYYHHIYGPQIMYINSSLKYVHFFRVILCSMQSSNMTDIKMFLSLLVWWQHLMIHWS